MSDTCKSCGAAIVWAKTVNGKNIPLDAEQTRDGNIDLRADGVAVVVTQGFYKSHFATCPNAKDHRKLRKPR